MDGHSHISSVVRTPNANTRFVATGPRIEAQWLDEAYVRARALEVEPMAVPGVRLVWWRGLELGWHDLVAHPRAYAVVGRHTRCDVALPNDAAVALRHLLVRATALEDGTPATQVLDLRSGLGFHLDDDVERRAIVATGVLALRVAGYALVALPSLVELPERRPAPEIVDAPRMPARAFHTGPTSSSITSMPPLSMLEDVARDVAAPGHAKVTLRRGGAWATVELPDHALEAGVLVGRAERCEPRLRPVLSESVSRVHLLLLREHGVVHAFDVASMQGLWANGARVRRVRLPEQGSTLRLASKDPVMLEWHPCG
ncbi:MAG TPA: FHA domain-containing protein [Polyangiaceae bacterium]